jgi:hypothetical protein
MRFEIVIACFIRNKHEDGHLVSPRIELEPSCFLVTTPSIARPLILPLYSMRQR